MKRALTFTLLSLTVSARADIPRVYLADPYQHQNTYEQHIETGWRLERRGAGLVIVNDPHVLGYRQQHPDAVHTIREEKRGNSDSGSSLEASQQSFQDKTHVPCSESPGFTCGSGEFFKGKSKADPLTRVISKSDRKYTTLTNGLKAIVNHIAPNDPDYLELMESSKASSNPETINPTRVRKDGYFESMPSSKMEAGSN